MIKLYETVISKELDKIVDIGSNGSDADISEHLNMKDKPDYAYMLRTVNFNNYDFKNNLKYIDKESYEYFKKSKVYGDEIVINKIGSPGSVGIVPKLDRPISLGLNQFALVFKNTVDQKYMYYYLKNFEPHLKRMSHGSITKTLTKDDIKDLKVFLPDLDYQKKVASFLGKLDKLIEINNEIISKLKDLNNEIFDYWFLQFNYPNSENKAYKENGGKLIYNEKMKMNIPLDWKVDNLTSLIKWVGTSQPPKSTFKYEYEEGYIRFIQNRDYDKEDHITYIKKTANVRTCTEKDIMMDKYGDAGKIRYGLEGAYNVALSKIEVKRDIYREYIRNYLSLPAVYNYLHNSCVASTRASLSEDNLSFLNVIIPSDEVLKKYNSLVEKNIDIIICKMKENRMLNNTINSLLPLLINGQIKIED